MGMDDVGPGLPFMFGPAGRERSGHGLLAANVSADAPSLSETSSIDLRVALALITYGHWIAINRPSRCSHDGADD